MRMSLLMLVAGAVAAGAVAAAVVSKRVSFKHEAAIVARMSYISHLYITFTSFTQQRQVVTPSHPLAGSVDKRMKLFSTLAGEHANADRPARRVDGDEYHLDNDGRAWAV